MTNPVWVWSYLAKNHISVTRLKQFVYICQMHNTTTSVMITHR